MVFNPSNSNTPIGIEAFRAQRLEDPLAYGLGGQAFIAEGDWCLFIEGRPAAYVGVACGPETADADESLESHSGLGRSARTSLMGRARLSLNRMIFGTGSVFGRFGAVGRQKDVLQIGQLSGGSHTTFIGDRK